MFFPLKCILYILLKGLFCDLFSLSLSLGKSKHRNTSSSSFKMKSIRFLLCLFISSLGCIYQVYYISEQYFGYPTTTKVTIRRQTTSWYLLLQSVHSLEVFSNHQWKVTDTLLTKFPLRIGLTGHRMLILW